MMPASRRKKIALLSLGLVTAAMVVPVERNALQAKSSDENKYLEALRACQTEADANQRLACLDKASKSLIAAADGGELTIVDREKVRDTRRKLFGFSIPDFGIFGGHEKDRGDDKEFETLDTTITKVRYGVGGSLILTTQEGAVWQIDDAPNALRFTRAGQKLEIRKGALTAYFLRIGNQPSVKGRRIG